MRIVRTTNEMNSVVHKYQRNDFRIGFVPTMGAFHEGHLSLMKESLSRCDRTIVSIFVNPLQFGPNEDYKKYPRNEATDLRKARSLGVHIVFFPSVKEMYPDGFETHIMPSSTITHVFEGAIRPGHFQGVATIVAKLFNIVRPHVAYFGQKDAQQVAVIKQMTRDLNYALSLKVLPTLREKTGLAMSSRNTYLSSQEKIAATVLYRSLVAADKLVRCGENKPKRVLDLVRRIVKSEKLVVLQYAALVDPDTFKNITGIKNDILLVIAAKIGFVRLIDNIKIGA